MMFQGIVNARDLGGIRIEDKVVRSGLLLRTGHLHDATPEDIRRLQEEFHLRRIFDFRSIPEAGLQPDVEVPGAEVIQLPTLDIEAETARGDAIPDETWLNLPLHIVRLSFTKLFQEKGRSLYPSLVLSEYSQLQYAAFLNLILDLRARGLEPLVVKGAICRALYPKPLLRTSVDDDLLIPADRAPAFHGALLELGLICDGSDSDPETAGELSYHRPDSPLYIELHKELFDRESPVFSGWNGYFSGAEDRSVPFQAQDVVLKTMCPTDHLLFLILHAFKHFLFSGFGLRIISDIALFAREYAGEIDFDAVCRACGELRCLPFAAASFRIAEKYLGIQAPAAFSAVEVDEGPLLEDVLEAGIHGQYIDRLHSANITLQTVAADRQGERGKKSGLRASLFPSARQLQGRYPFLKRRPWLLPAAWVRRIGADALQRREGHQGSPTASLRIGRERVALLETYDIIDPQ